MRYITLGLILIGQITLMGQVNFPKDTVEMRLDAGQDIQNEMALYITNNGSTDLDYNYTIIYDGFKSTPNWNVQFCDCENCLENYPASGSCTGLKAGESWPFAVYVLTDDIMDGKHMTIAWVNPNDAADTDTVTVKTIKGNLLSTGSFTDPKKSFKVSPNPAQDHINIQMDGAHNSGSVNVQIVDLSGSVVYSTLTELDNAGNIDLSIADIDGGVYILTATSADQVYTERIVIK